MTKDENNRELNEFFYELATGLALPTTIPAIFDRRFWILRGSSGATRSKAKVVKLLVTAFVFPRPSDSAFRREREMSITRARRLGSGFEMRAGIDHYADIPEAAWVVKLPNGAGPASKYDYTIKMFAYSDNVSIQDRRVQEAR